MEVGDIRYLTGSQAAMLSPIEHGGLKLDVKTGEYLKYVGDTIGKNGAYEVMFSPYETPCTGHRADTLIVDDVTSDDAFFQESWLSKWLKMDPSNRPQPEWDCSSYVTKLKKEIKEKEMEIGGNRCHLCGAGVLYASDSSTYRKKNVHTEKHMVYQCGTQVLETNKRGYLDADIPYPVDNPDRHIHAECI